MESFLQFHQPDPAYVEFLFSIPRGSSVGIYARKNAIPTLTMNDIRDVLTGQEQRRAGHEDCGAGTNL